MNINETATQAKRRYTRAGKIRVGGMLPTKACRENPQAMELYRSGIDLGIKFDTIAEKIAAETGIRNPLYPDAKVPFFRMAAEDFPLPGIREKILARYGEDRGDGNGRQLYAFPINVLTHDDIQVGYRQAKGDPMHESFIMNGKARMCRAKIFASPQRGASRGSKVTPIYEIKGPCNPENCPLALSGKCHWCADIWFQIPGIGVRSMFQLSTGSEFATEDLAHELDRIWRLNGTGGQTWLTKKQMTTRYGSKPYIICLMELDADPDITMPPPSPDVLPPPTPETQEPQVTQMPVDPVTVQPEIPTAGEMDATDTEGSAKAQVMALLERFGLKGNQAVMDYLSAKYGDWFSDEAKCQAIAACLLKFERHGSRAGMLFQIKILVETFHLDNRQVHAMLKDAVAQDYALDEEKLTLALDYLRTYVNGLPS